jgi:chemosensory pili system protein ChpA (sensor histidine kinase/response regulator)
MGDGTLVPLLNLPELLAAPIAVTAAAAGLAAAARLQARRILVVDDSLSVRKGLMQLLQDAAYEVKGAGDGMEAIRVLESFKPHLICTDMEMPNMNGMELAQHLRMEGTTQNLPIIMITSRSTEKHREQAMRAGVDFYLTKPYSDADLLKHVHNALQPGFVHEVVAAV